MDFIRSEQVTEQARLDFRAYLRSFAFWSYVLRLQKKIGWLDLAGWRGHWRGYHSLQTFGLALSREGKLLPGLVIMRNTLLADRRAAAPALVLATFDFSAAGLDELNTIADRIVSLRDHSPDPAIRRAASAIYEDEQYKIFRRRPLPACVGAPDHVFLFDELMRGDDLVEMNFDGEKVSYPFVVLFANRNDPIPASALVPRQVSTPVLSFLVAQRLMSSAPVPRPGTTEQPPPLPGASHR